MSGNFQIESLADRQRLRRGLDRIAVQARSTGLIAGAADRLNLERLLVVAVVVFAGRRVAVGALHVTVEARQVAVVDGDVYVPVSENEVAGPGGHVRQR